MAVGFWLGQIGGAQAAMSEQAARNVLVNEQGDTLTLTRKDLTKGQRLFNDICAHCHAGGVTYTNPNVGLDTETLALATPPRNTVDAMVDYMKNPTTYDGEDEIYELHPSLRSTDIFPAMRGLTDPELRLIAGYILYEAQLKGIAWGGGKIYY
ncbi:MAG: cytochrome c-550 [Oscillatoriales cyanobacterium SM2_1_8]|nr:cytochrome c-550 [Oscillatoriales cyanobacterium SM2_1_8]